MMKEKDIQRLFRKKNTLFGVFELKLCKGKSIRWDAVMPHQVEALTAISGDSGFFHKLTDPPVFHGMQTRFNAKRPFDCFHLRNIPAYVVICWYVPRMRKTCYYIPIDVYIHHRSDSERKSFREDEADAMACHRLELM